MPEWTLGEKVSKEVMGEEIKPNSRLPAQTIFQGRGSPSRGMGWVGPTDPPLSLTSNVGRFFPPIFVLPTPIGWLEPPRGGGLKNKTVPASLLTPGE